MYLKKCEPLQKEDNSSTSATKTYLATLYPEGLKIVKCEYTQMTGELQLKKQ